MTRTRQVGHVDVDRGGLTAVLDRFLEAVLKHDPSAAPLAPDFRSTENTVEVQPGEGIWSTAVGLGELRRRYADPASGQVGFYGLIEEATGPAVVALRLRVADGQVSEAEWAIARTDNEIFLPAGVIANPPPEAPVRGDLRSSREDMAAAADSYYDGLEAYDHDSIRAHPEAYRVENGTWVIGRLRDPLISDGITQPNMPLYISLGSAAKFDGQKAFQRPIPVLDRHYFVDEEAGVVWYNAIIKASFPSMGDKGHTATKEHAEAFTQNKTPSTTRGGALPGILVVELFKVEQGKIRGLHVLMQPMSADWDRTTGTRFASSAS